MQRSLLIAIALVLIAAGAVYFYTAESGAVFEDDVTLYVYTMNGEPTGTASIAVPFARTIGERMWLSAVVDGGAWRVENAPAHVADGARNLVHIPVPDGAEVSDGDTLFVSLALTPDKLAEWDGTEPADGEYLETTAHVSSYDIGDVIGTDIPGWGPEIYRGSPGAAFAPFTPAVAHADSHVIDTYTDLEIPDTTQQPGECAPTAASNAITGLTNGNGGSGLPETRDMIEELKRDMNFNDGVHGPQNFVRGKNIFAGRHGLPIVTEEIQSPTIEEIAEAIDNGCAIEADLAFFENRNGRSVQVGNHMVNLTGAYSDGETTGIHGVDPATPDGVELWRFAERDPWPLINYSSTHATAIKRIYTQCWVAEEASMTAPDETENRIGTDADRDTPSGETTGSSGGGESTDDGNQEVSMLVFDGQYFPAHQFTVAGPDACDADHYHVSGGIAYGLPSADATKVISKTDPNPRECGFGRVSQVPVETVTISYEQGLELVKYLVD